MSNMGMPGQRLELRPLQMTWSHKSTKNMWKTDERIVNVRQRSTFQPSLLFEKWKKSSDLRCAEVCVPRSQPFVMSRRSLVASLTFVTSCSHSCSSATSSLCSVFARGCKQQAKYASFWTSVSRFVIINHFKLNNCTLHWTKIVLSNAQTTCNLLTAMIYFRFIFILPFSRNDL